MTIAPAHVVIERQTYVAAFGLALWDGAAGRLAAEGLEVRVAPQVAGRTLAPIAASPNRGGVFVIHRLPDAPASPPEPLLVEVHDPLGRFAPFVMHVDAGDEPGLIAPPCVAGLDGAAAASPPALRSFVPLFSTPARTPPAGSAVVRASLDNRETRGPAAGAVVEVRDAGRVLGRGIADARGEAMVAFPYPEPSVLPPWSPPARPAPPVPLTAQSWPLEIAVRCRRALPVYQVDATRPPAPDLCELLAQPVVVLQDITLHYGQEFVLAGPAGPLVVDPA